MISSIAIKVKTNMCVVSLELFIVHTIYVSLFQLILRIQLHIITTITVRSLFLSAYNIFASHSCTLFFTQLRCSNLQPQHKTDWLQLTHWLLYLILYIHTSLVCRTFSPFRDLYHNSLYICILHLSVTSACSCWFRCSMYLLVYICVLLLCVIHLSHTHADVIVGLLLINVNMC